MQTIKLVSDNITIIFSGDDAYDKVAEMREFLDSKDIYYKLYAKRLVGWRRLHTIRDLEIK